jgi:Mg-chelatase subunit ChlD
MADIEKNGSIKKGAGQRVDPFEQLRNMQKAFSQRVVKTKELKIALDRSGSMSESAGTMSRMEAASKATIEMVKRYSNRVKLGVLGFDESVELVDHDKIEYLRPRGGTMFQVALSEFTTHGMQCVLLSDGEDNNNKQLTLEEIPRLVASQIVVHTIGVGHSASGMALLQEIAQATGGKFLRVEEDASQIFTAIDALVSKAVAALEAGDSHVIAAGGEQ